MSGIHGTTAIAAFRTMGQLKASKQIAFIKQANIAETATAWRDVSQVENATAFVRAKK